MEPAEQFTFQPTNEQQEIIGFRGGNLQITACAGSGKTETVSQRVASLIFEGVEPQSIIAFTFTERAAASLKSRIFRRVEDKMGSAITGRLPQLYVGTIHAYCLKLLQEHVPQYQDFDILDDHQHAALLSREHLRLNLSRIRAGHWAPIRDFIRNADVVENELIDPNRLPNTGFGACYRDYKKTLENYRFLTYGQLIAAAVNALTDPSIFERIHSPLRHFIVDEYQDINPAQERLIQLLSRPPVQLCVVGDDDQAIYQWRGSDVRNMQTFVQRYNGRAFSLSTNRRSRPQIIQSAAAFAARINPRLPKKMIPYRATKEPEVSFWTAETPDAEAKTIAKTIKRLISKGHKPRNIAILLRSVRTSSPPIIEALKDAGIPYRCAGRTGLFLQEDAQILGKTYAWLIDQNWKTGHWEIGRPVTLKGLLTEHSSAFLLSNPAKEKLKALLEKWKKRAANDGQRANLIREYYELLRVLGVHKWDMESESKVARLGSLACFSLLLRDFEHVTRRARWVEKDGKRQFRGGQNFGTWYYRRLFNYIQYYALDAYEDFEGEAELETDAVDILTVHQAKGLEWPVVFIPALVARRFPSKNTGSAGTWYIPPKLFPAEKRQRYEGTITDERRLFYVAMTRARDVVYASCFRHQKNKVSASLFFSETATGTVDDPKSLPIPDYQPEREAEPDKAVLSFSDLASYERCPLSYRLSALLGFQPQIAQELGYGRAIHHVLRRIADQAKKKGKLPTPAETAAIIETGFYLPFAGAVTFDELRKAAGRLVDRYLNQYADDLFRTWDTERPFELQLQEAAVSGRADVILDREGGEISAMALVDYKTGTDPRSDDLYRFQLATYSAAGREEGINVKAAYVHDLKEGIRIPVPVKSTDTDSAKERARGVIQSIVNKNFQAAPEAVKCRECDTRFVCRHGPNNLARD